MKRLRTILTLIGILSSGPSLGGSAAAAQRASTLHPITIMQSIDCNPDERAAPESKVPTNADPLAQGDSALRQDRCGAAIVAYTAYIQANPTSVKGYWRRALVEGAQASGSGVLKQFESVNDDMDRALAIAPRAPEFYELRCFARLAHSTDGMHVSLMQSRKSLENAFKDCSTAIELSPDFGEAYATRFRVDNAKQDAVHASYDSRKASALDPVAYASADARLWAVVSRRYGSAQSKYKKEWPRPLLFFASDRTNL